MFIGGAVVVFVCAWRAPRAWSWVLEILLDLQGVNNRPWAPAVFILPLQCAGQKDARECFMLFRFFPGLFVNHGGFLINKGSGLRWPGDLLKRPSGWPRHCQ